MSTFGICFFGLGALVFLFANVFVGAVMVAAGAALIELAN